MIFGDFPFCFLEHVGNHSGFSLGFAQFLAFGPETSCFHPASFLILGGFGLICRASLYTLLWPIGPIGPREGTQRPAHFRCWGALPPRHPNFSIAWLHFSRMSFRRKLSFSVQANEWPKTRFWQFICLAVSTLGYRSLFESPVVTAHPTWHKSWSGEHCAPPTWHRFSFAKLCAKTWA